MKKEKVKNLNKTTYLRNQNGFFQMVPIRLINDDRLSPYAKFIMITCISNNDEWVINRNEIKDRVGFEEFKFRKGWDELKKYRYIEIVRRKRSCHYMINETPNYDTPNIDKGIKSSSDDRTLGPNLDTGINDKGINLIYTKDNIDQTLDPKTKVLKGHVKTGDNSSDKRMNFVTRNDVPPGTLRFDSILNEFNEKDALDLDLDTLNLDIDINSLRLP